MTIKQIGEGDQRDKSQLVDIGRSPIKISLGLRGIDELARDIDPENLGELARRIRRQDTPDLIKDLKSPVDYYRRIAAFELGFRDDAPVQELMELFSGDKDPYVRAATAYALGNKKGEKVGEFLARAIDSEPNNEVKEFIFWALCKNDSNASRQKVYSIISDFPEWLQRHYAGYLRHLSEGSGLVDVVKGNVKHDFEGHIYSREAQRIFFSIDALGIAGTDDAVEILREAAVKGNSFIKSAALDALGDMDDRAIGIIPELANSNNFGKAAKALATIGCDKAVDAIRGIITKFQNGTYIEESFDSLARIGSDYALKTITEMAVDESLSDNTRWNAYSSIDKFDATRALSALRSIADSPHLSRFAKDFIKWKIDELSRRSQEEGREIDIDSLFTAEKFPGRQLGHSNALMTISGLFSGAPGDVHDKDVVGLIPVGSLVKGYHHPDEDWDFKVITRLDKEGDTAVYKKMLSDMSDELPLDPEFMRASKNNTANFSQINNLAENTVGAVWHIFGGPFITGRECIREIAREIIDALSRNPRGEEIYDEIRGNEIYHSNNISKVGEYAGISMIQVMELRLKRAILFTLPDFETTKRMHGVS